MFARVVVLLALIMVCSGEVSLVFKRDAYVKGSDRIPQMQCIGELCLNEYIPQQVRCTHAGTVGAGWRCPSDDMFLGHIFGKIYIQCENNQDLETCGLVYEIIDRPIANSYEFYSHKITTGKRPVPQMRCVGALCSNITLPDSILCNFTNHEVRVWSCGAKLKDGYTLGTTYVQCDETGSFPSCSLVYEVRQSATIVQDTIRTVSTLIFLIFLITVFCCDRNHTYKEGGVYDD